MADYTVFHRLIRTGQIAPSFADCSKPDKFTVFHRLCQTGQILQLDVIFIQIGLHLVKLGLNLFLQTFFRQFHRNLPAV